MERGRAIPRWIFWSGVTATLVFLAGLALWMAQASRGKVGSADERPLEGLRVFGLVPPFSLIERSGKQASREDLIGKVWVANFIYTHCPDTCPVQSAQMAKFQVDFAEERDLRLVSITVDPERDTLEILSQYADRYGADRDRWLFLTGEKGAIYHLAQEGFRLSVVDPEQRVRIWLFEPGPVFAHHGETGKQFIHSSRFVLVDRQAQIRGYYQSTDEEALRRLHRDVRTLLLGEK